MSATNGSDLQWGRVTKGEALLDDMKPDAAAADQVPADTCPPDRGQAQGQAQEQPGRSAVDQRIAVVDDHVLVRDGIASAAREVPGVSVVSETDCLAELAALQPPADLVLLDMDLHGTAVRPDEVAQIGARGSRILIVSAMAKPPIVRQLMAQGVAGYVPKRDSTAEVLGEAIAAVLRGEYWTTPALAAVLSADTSSDRPELSDREREALALYASGFKMSSVGRRMGISPHTAKRYIDRVRAKYCAVGRDIGSKTDLYKVAVSDGILPGSGHGGHGGHGE